METKKTDGFKICFLFSFFCLIRGTTKCWREIYNKRLYVVNRLTIKHKNLNIFW